MKKKPLMLNNHSWFEQANKFAKNYKLERIILGKNKEVLKCSTQDICRFCQRSKPEVSFKQETHIIPQQLHRAKPISKFECDSCNELFSKFESDFGHYFQIDKSLFGHTKKKSGYTIFNTKGGSKINRESDIEKIRKVINLSPELEDKILKDKIRILNLFTSFCDVNNKIIKNDNENFTFRLIRPPYRPINVLKTFLKIGISMINESQITEYSKICEFLTNENLKLDFDTTLYVTQIPILRNFYPDSIVYLYSRISSDKYYDKTLVLFFGNKIFQISIPSNHNLQQYPDIKTIRESPYKNPYILSNENIEKEEFVKHLEKANFHDEDLKNHELVRESTFEESLKIELSD